VKAETVRNFRFSGAILLAHLSCKWEVFQKE